MELVCVRHGRTAWNADRRFQGQTDIPLDHEGLAQARALAVHLRDERFDLAVASDLVRARVTAETICAGRDLRLELEPQLREMTFGSWEGMTWPEIAARWPDLASEYETSPRAYTPEGGESWEHVCARVEVALRRITGRLSPEGRGLVVSHAGVMHAILHVARRTQAGGDDGDELRVKLVPAAIVRLRGSFDDGWTVVAVNETAAAPASSAP